jgi:Winged helix-turn helix
MHQGPGPAVENSVAIENTPEQRQRIQMVLLRKSGLTQPLIAAAMGVSLSTVNRAHMVYDQGGIKALKPRPSGGQPQLVRPCSGSGRSPGSAGTDQIPVDGGISCEPG